MTNPMPLAELRQLCDQDGTPRPGDIQELKAQRIAHAKAQRNLIDAATLDHPSDGFTATERRLMSVHETAIALVDTALRDAEADVRARVDGEADVRRRFPGAFADGRSSWQREDEERAALQRWARGEGPRTLTIPVDVPIRLQELRGKGYGDDEARALLWDTGSIASGIPTHVANEIYQHMTAGVAMLAMPTHKVVTDDGAPFVIPKVNAHGIGTQIIAQGTAIGGTDPTFTKTQLDAYKYGQVVQIANEVIQDSAFDVVDFINADLTRSLYEVVDADLVAGTGTGEPLGVMVALASGGSVTTGGSLITPTFENLVDLQYSVNDRYRRSSSAAWLMRDATAGVLRKLRDGNGGTIGAPLWSTSLTAGIAGASQPPLLLGAPAYTDPNVASLASNARVAAFGDWNAYYVRLVGGIQIDRSDDYAFTQDLVTFRAKMRVDGDLVDTGAIKSLLQNV